MRTPLGPATGMALRGDGEVIAILGSQGVGLVSTAERGLLADAVPRRGAVSLSLDPSGDRIVHDYVFASGSTSVFRRGSGEEWSETVVASGGAVASWGIPFAEERFEAQFDLRGMADSMAGQVLERPTGEVVGEVPLAPTAIRIGEELIAVGTDDGIVTIHRYPSGEPVRVLDDWVNLADSEPAAGLVATFSTLEYNQELGRLLVVDWTGRVGYWDTESWEFNVILDQSDIFFGDNQLVTLGQDQTARFWDLERREKIGEALTTEGAAAFDVQPATRCGEEHDLGRVGTVRSGG